MNASRKRNKIDRVLEDGLTVAQLIEALRQMPDDAVVVFGCDYGDICHTEQALVVRKVDELDPGTRLETSAYSNSGVAIERLDDEDEVEDEMDDETTQVVILRS